MYKKVLCFIFMASSAVILYSAEGVRTNFNKVAVASVYDGDTFKVYLSCSYAVFCKAIPIRVKGIDAPEIKTKNPEQKSAALKAQAFTKNFLNNGKVVLRNCERDKYFRLLCDVRAEGKNLAEELLKEGLAVPYDGGTKQQ
ncbi:MAG: thermonuclease family protein [Elusimicrobiota bacterium]|jgi:endonuclease YncB( thermonuclease family)|nr:thermonuclease family protein [Elusimicrobiota bacterium]